MKARSQQHGDVYDASARGQGARLLQQALAITAKWATAPAKAPPSTTSAVYDARGQMDKALDTYQQALAICREVGDRSGEGTPSTTSARSIDARGQMRQGARHLPAGPRHSAAKWATAPAKAPPSTTSAGSTARAARCTRRSTSTSKPSPFSREVGDRSGEGTTLNNIGVIYDARGQTDRGARLLPAGPRHPPRSGRPLRRRHDPQQHRRDLRRARPDWTRRSTPTSRPSPSAARSATVPAKAPPSTTSA